MWDTSVEGFIVEKSTFGYFLVKLMTSKNLIKLHVLMGPSENLYLALKTR